jgi:chromosome partitioning protein
MAPDSAATVSRGTSKPEASPSPAVSRETTRPIRIAVINQKGGVGKTTTTINVAYDLASRGYSTLVIDLDPQGNASTALGVDRYAENVSTSYELLFQDALPHPPVVIGPGEPEILPGNVGLIRAEMDLLAFGDQRDQALRNALSKLPKQYDFILFDSPPSLGILTLNILIASRYVLIPIQCEYLALEGLSMLLDTLGEIRNAHNTTLEILGCLITMTDLRTNLSQQVVTDVRQHLGELVFDTMVPRTVRLSECPSHGQTIFQYDRWGPGARSYESLTKEILARLGLPNKAAETTTRGGAPNE